MIFINESTKLMHAQLHTYYIIEHSSERQLQCFTSKLIQDNMNGVRNMSSQNKKVVI